MNSIGKFLSALKDYFIKIKLFSEIQMNFSQILGSLLQSHRLDIRHTDQLSIVFDFSLPELVIEHIETTLVSKGTSNGVKLFF